MSARWCVLALAALFVGCSDNICTNAPTTEPATYDGRCEVDLAISSMTACTALQLDHLSWARCMSKSYRDASDCAACAGCDHSPEIYACQSGCYDTYGQCLSAGMNEAFCLGEKNDCVRTCGPSLTACTVPSPS